jgi:hypothetical protein
VGIRRAQRFGHHRECPPRQPQDKQPELTRRPHDTMKAPAKRYTLEANDDLVSLLASGVHLSQNDDPSFGVGGMCELRLGLASRAGPRRPRRQSLDEGCPSSPVH